VSQPGDIEVPFTVQQFTAISENTAALQANTKVQTELYDYVKKIDQRLTRIEHIQAGLIFAAALVGGLLTWGYMGTSIFANLHKS